MAVKLLEGQTVGIDLGTTYSSIAQLDDEGNPQLIMNVDDRDITPSVVLLGDTERGVVGPSFARIAEETPDRIVEAIKREMGNKDFHVVYQDRKLTPEFVSALILKKLKQDAEQQIGPIANAVITVPYYFNDIRRKATQDAGRIAGLNVIDIVNEPTAATLAHAWEKGELGRSDLEQVERTILVYDLGGGTFDVTVVRYTPTNFKVLATDGDVMLGGLDWSRRLVDHVADEFQKRFDLDPREDATSLRQLTQDCEDAKRRLSESAQVPIEVYFQGNTMTVSVSRGEFERLTGDLLERTKTTTVLVLEQAGVGPGDLDELVLVGGSTHMPVVEQMLTDICQRPPNRDVHPEQAVGHGAAIHAAILEARATGGETRMGKAIINRLRSVSTADVNSHSLGTKVGPKDDKKNHIMIGRNTELPFHVTQRFSTNVENQQRIHVTVLEGEVEDPDACATIGDFYITNLPAGLPKGAPVEVTYAYDAAGRINCTARELTSNNEASIEIIRGSGLDTDGVNSFETLAEKYLVE